MELPITWKKTVYLTFSELPKDVDIDKEIRSEENIAAENELDPKFIITGTLHFLVHVLTLKYTSCGSYWHTPLLFSSLFYYLSYCTGDEVSNTIQESIRTHDEEDVTTLSEKIKQKFDQENDNERPGEGVAESKEQNSDINNTDINSNDNSDKNNSNNCEDDKDNANAFKGEKRANEDNDDQNYPGNLT